MWSCASRRLATSFPISESNIARLNANVGFSTLENSNSHPAAQRASILFITLFRDPTIPLIASTSSLLRHFSSTTRNRMLVALLAFNNVEAAPRRDFILNPSSGSKPVLLSCRTIRMSDLSFAPAFKDLHLTSDKNESAALIAKTPSPQQISFSISLAFSKNRNCGILNTSPLSIDSITTSPEIIEYSIRCFSFPRIARTIG